MIKYSSKAIIIVLAFIVGMPKVFCQKQPNVIFIMTDDQGIGDLSAHGNPWIKTPNIDAFYEESVRLTNFHVSPMCTPTRAAIMTGLYPINNGVWATFKGRDFLHPNLLTLAEVFKANNYTTGLFGKWHLGDNYPSRPTDRGFDIAYQHASGGVGELSDYWGNDYFDDTYLVNNIPQKFEGYCTDIWFTEAISFMKQHKNEPFFLYLTTNAPHTPLYVDEKYAKPYKELVGNKIPSAEFYGMITNIDENMGRFDKALEELGLKENTIVVFCSDNGSGSGVNLENTLGWNHGFRGKKGQNLEGGHRVPFFIRWPKGGLQGGKDVTNLAAHVDVLPTLASLCDIELPKNYVGDGLNLSDKLVGKNIPDDRMVYVHYNQNYTPPNGVLNSCLLQNDWRLIDGDKLYNIKADRKQLNNVYDENPEIAKDLLAKNELFLDKARNRKEYQQFAYTQIGTNHQQKTKLTIQHAIGDDGPIWQQEEIAAGLKNKNAQHPISITKKGIYKISCSRWPEEAMGKIHGLPNDISNTQQYPYKTIQPEKVSITLFGKTYEKEITADDEKVSFKLPLEIGETMLEAYFKEKEEKYGVYYTYIELVP